MDDLYCLCLIVESPILVLIGLALSFAWRMTRSKGLDRVMAFGWFVFLLASAVFLVAFQVVIVTDFSMGPPLDYSGWNYRYITWSPDGSRLAFGLAEDAWGSRGLIVMNADASHVRRLAFADRDDFFNQPYVYGIRWSQSGEVLYFKAASHDPFFDDWVPPDEQTYRIDVESGLAQQISAFQYPPAPTWETRDPNPPPTACDDPHYRTARVLHTNGLLAQSACIETEYGWSVPLHECYQDLQICDTVTGEMVAVYDDNPLYDRPSGVPNDAVFVSSIGMVGGLFVAISAVLYRWARWLVTQCRDNDRSETQRA